MPLSNQVLFITGANRGIGKALVEAALKSGAKKIYAAARDVSKLPDFGDKRVVPLALDITDRNSIQKAAKAASDVQVLINNAGALKFASVVNGKPEDLMSDMQVNYFGTLSMVSAFAPVIEANGGGHIANFSSIIGLAPMAGVGGYSASKAAVFSATQAMRAELKPKKIQVHGVFPGPIDTDMAKDFPMQKTAPSVVAENVLTSMEQGVEDIFPDPMSSQLGALWQKDPKALERQFASAG